MQIHPLSSPPAVIVPSRESSILDTTNESYNAIVNNSDSFRGDRLQDEPPLSITGLDSTDYSQLVLSDTTQLPTSPVKSEQPNQSNPTTHINYSPVTPTPTAPATAHSGLSLQEAFLRRKKNFLKKSQQRLEQIKATIEEQKAHQASTLKETFGRKHRSAVTSATFGSKSSFSGSQGQELDSVAEKRRRVVTFASPLLQTSAETTKPHIKQGGVYVRIVCMCATLKNGSFWYGVH